MLAVVAMSYEEEAEAMNEELEREAELTKNAKKEKDKDECTIRTNSPRCSNAKCAVSQSPDTAPGCGQCGQEPAQVDPAPDDHTYVMIKARQSGTGLKQIDLEATGQPGVISGVTTPPHSGACPNIGAGPNSYKAKFNITVPLVRENRGQQLLSPQAYSFNEEDDNSLSNYSSGSSNQESSLNDSGVVGDHDQDSLSDHPVNPIQNQIINCEPKAIDDRRPSKIEIPFVVSIETTSDRNCDGCRKCCLNYKCWLRVQDVFYHITNDPFFEAIVTLCIILNTLFLAAEHHGMSEDLKYVLDIGNKVFTSFFLLEACLKLVALSKEYFGNGWNIFDLLIVVASLLDLGLESVDGISVLRGMRLMRVLKLAQSWTTMKVLLSIIISTLGALGNLTFILLIVIYIFAVLGMQLFGKDYTEENFYPDPIPRWNFKDFFHSFMMIFRILCGEWIEPLWDCMRVEAKVGFAESCLLIFLPSLVVGNFMVLNLFLALLLNSFNCEELKSRKEEVEDCGEPSVYTKKINKFKEKIQEKKAKLMGIASLNSTNKFSSNGSLLSQNGIKYNSEPELNDKREVGRMSSKNGNVPETDGYITMRDEDYDMALDPNVSFKCPSLEATGAHFRHSKSEQDISSICQKSKSLTFDSITKEEDRSEATKPIGPDPCFPDIVTKLCCSCMEGTWMQAQWDLVRGVVHDVVDNPFFEWTILLLIFASSLSLCFEDINLQDNEELKFILKIVNLVFAVLFTVEMFLKWIAFGLFRYFSSSWTCLDFVIVCVSVLSIAIEGSANLTAFRSLRTLRALRPLRAISRWQGMKIVVNALMYAIPSIINVLLVCLVFWLIFSIMGVQFFGGKFFKCLDDQGERLNTSIVNYKWDCERLNYTWVNSKINFDHVGHAYLALFQVATFEGWMEIMADAVDAREVDEQPEWEASIYNYFYFVIFIVCGSFFTLNLFIGVIIDNFNALKKKYEGGVLEMFLTESQKHYYTAMKKLGRKKPQKVIKRPQNPYHALFYDISVSRRFEIAIFVLIFLNMVSMGIEHYDQSRAVTFVLEICNALFTTIFSLEATVKMIGLRHHYFTAAWNLFDFVLVIASIVGILMEDLMTDFPVSPTLLRVVRVFRIGRILRLIKAAKGIRKLLFALIVSLPALFNIGALLALITFIYAIIGMTIFGHVKHQGAINDLVNFETFGRSMQVLFRLVTSAGWNDVLDPLMVSPPDCEPDYKQLPNGNCGHPFVAIVYFVSFIIINFMIVINMYIAIILENFNQAHQEEEIGIVEEDLEMFYGKWSKFDPHATQFITFNQISDFIASLDPPLGIPKPNTLALVSFDLPIAKGDKIHCLDVLHSLTKHTLGFIDDDSEDFSKLAEQMDEKFKKQFPTRKELEIVSSTREWKRLDIAARTIQKFYRTYIRDRALADMEPRIDTETQTRRRNNLSEEQSARTLYQESDIDFKTHSLPSLGQINSQVSEDTDLEQDLPNEYCIRKSMSRMKNAIDGSKRSQSLVLTDEGEFDDELMEISGYGYPQDQPTQMGYARQEDETYGRQEEVHHKHKEDSVHSRRDDGSYTKPVFHFSKDIDDQGGNGKNNKRTYDQEISDHNKHHFRQPKMYSKHSNQDNDQTNHPHYHEFEDEVCFKCTSLGQEPPGRRRDYQYDAESQQHQSERPYGYAHRFDHNRHTKGPEPQPNILSDINEVYFQGRHMGSYNRQSMFEQYYEHEEDIVSPRKRSRKYGSEQSVLNTEQSHVNQGGPDTLPRSSKVRRHGHREKHHHPDPDHSPERSRLEPEKHHYRQDQPHDKQRHKPERSPDKQRHKPKPSPEKSRHKSEKSPEKQHQRSEQSPEKSRHRPDPSPTNTDSRKKTHERSMQKVSPKRGDRAESVSKKEMDPTKSSLKPPHSYKSLQKQKLSDHVPGASGRDLSQSRSPKYHRDATRQSKTISVAEPLETIGAHHSPKTPKGHQRTKSESDTRTRVKGRVQRQSPVQERLSVHEDDSMSDAFDDEGLFQIDENFAKFLDDKTSCQK